MARRPRLEAEGGIYHVINRGNYRMDIFEAAKTKTAFLKCVGEASVKSGWRVHAWCIMSNHYHLALETPQANLVDGMKWLQGTFATRFNRLRKASGHLFQGRYKSLYVDPDGLGSLCHYIHLNPVKAGLCKVQELPSWPWSSFLWLADPAKRPSWYDPGAALEHAGGLADTPKGRKKYLEYLEWLSEDEPARKAQKFDQMSKGWVIGTVDFKKDLIEEQKETLQQGKRLAAEMQEAREEIWRQKLQEFLKRLGKNKPALVRERKSAPWKVALAGALKIQTTVTNRWLGDALCMGNMYEVSRLVTAWLRAPDPSLARKLQITTNYKA
jgi:putative transposase